MEDIYLESVSFETFQIKEDFLRRLLSLANITTLCVQYATKHVLPRISKGLLKGSLPFLTYFWLAYIPLEQRTMEMIAVALRHRRTLECLELFKLEIDHPTYANIFYVVPKMRRFRLITVHSLSQREIFFLVKALDTPAIELQNLLVRQHPQRLFTNSPPHQRLVAAVVERIGGNLSINGTGARKFWTDFWPSTSN